MNFDDLDGTFEPIPDAALELVATRVHQLRVRRRLMIATSMVVLAVVTLAASVEFAAPSHRATHVSVTPTTAVNATTVPDTATATVPESTTTDAPTTTTTNAVPSLPPPTVDTAPPITITTTTVAPHDPSDWSQTTVTWDAASITMTAGEQRTVGYTVTNNGSWPVVLARPGCPVYLSPAPQLGADQYSDALWPQPVVAHGCAITAVLVHIDPGASEHFDAEVIAGEQNGISIIPSHGGYACVMAETAPGPADGACTQPYALVHILPPPTPPFTVNRPTAASVPSAGENRVPFTLTNNLGFAVNFVFEGPQTFGSDRGLCERSAGRYYWRCTIRLDANESLSMYVDLYGTSDLEMWPAGNTPRPPGVYEIPWNEITLELTVTP